MARTLALVLAACLCLAVGTAATRTLAAAEAEANNNSCAARAVASDPRIKAYVAQLSRSGVWGLLGNDLPVDSTMLIPAAALEGSDEESNPFAIALYHMVTVGSFSIPELIDDESIVTALPSHALAFGEDREGPWVAGSSGDRAHVLRSLKVCDTYIHIIDHALVPTSSDEGEQAFRALAEAPEAAPRRLVRIDDLFAPSPETAPVKRMLEEAALEAAALLHVDGVEGAAPAPAPSA